MAPPPPNPDQPSQDRSPERSQERFLSLFLASEREVYRYVCAIVPAREDADEIMQQTAVELWRKFDQFDLSLPFTPLACRFALNVAKQWLERKRRWRTLLSDGLAERIVDRREALLPAIHQRLKHLDACLDKLPASQRTIIEAYYFRKLPVGGVAAEVGRTVDAVYKALQRIRHALQECIERAEQLEIAS
jgi:RNA polymerase sigma-70 factor, ECF subfamily